MVLKPFQCPTDFSPRPVRGCGLPVEGRGVEGRLFGHPERAHYTAAARNVLDGRTVWRLLRFGLQFSPPPSFPGSAKGEQFLSSAAFCDFIAVPYARAFVHFSVSFRRPFGTIWYARPCKGRWRHGERCVVSPRKRSASRIWRKEIPKGELNSTKNDRFSCRLRTYINETA